MNRIFVSFELKNDFTEVYADKILEWLKYQLGQQPYLSPDNMLDDEDIKACSVGMRIIKKEV